MLINIADHYRDDYLSVAAALDFCIANKSLKKVYAVQLPIGLGGQISIRIDALIIALMLNRSLSFVSMTDAPYGQVFEDYGLRSEPGFDWDSCQQFRMDAIDNSAEVLVFDRGGSSIRNIDGLIKKEVVTAIASRLNLNSIDGLVIEGMIFNWLRISSAIKNSASEFAANFGISEKTIGVHFRRGDKSVESPYVPSEIINSKIESLARNGDYDSVFIASDSPDAVNEIKAPIGLRIIFDHAEKRFNNANHKMLFKDSSLSEQETFVAMKNIVALCLCGGVVGQNNAHFALLSASCIALKKYPSDAYVLLDGYMVVNNNFFWSLLYKIYKKIRNIGKRIFPWLTVKARSTRNQRNG